MSNKIFDIVFFHYPCQDGLTSGWIVNKFHNNNIELYPIQHGKKIDITDDFKNKKIIFCDYSPPLEILDELEKIAKEIVILDHHISAQKTLQNKDYAIFDMEKSGAGLTWEYFYPNIDMPNFVQMVQDRDLWKWEIQNSKELTSGLYTICSSIEMYDFKKLFKIFDELYENPFKLDFYIEIGNITNKVLLMKCKYMAKDHLTKITKYKDYNVCIVNCSSDMSSDLGNIISSSENVDFAVLWNYNHPKEEYRISLRSNNKVDVSIIAQEYGGGGHKNASGLTSKINPIILFDNK